MYDKKRKTEEKEKVRNYRGRAYLCSVEEGIIVDEEKQK